MRDCLLHHLGPNPLSFLPFHLVPTLGDNPNEQGEWEQIKDRVFRRHRRWKEVLFLCGGDDTPGLLFPKKTFGGPGGTDSYE